MKKNKYENLIKEMINEEQQKEEYYKLSAKQFINHPDFNININKAIYKYAMSKVKTDRRCFLLDDLLTEKNKQLRNLINGK